MLKFNYMKWLSLLIFSCSLALGSANTSSLTAFYYGNHPPIKILQLYHQVVVDPSSDFDPHQFDNASHQSFAYVSMGEMDPAEINKQKIPSDWIIAQNKTWHSAVIDQTNPAWQKYFIEQMITPLWNKGYRGFFLDTLDSYTLAKLDPAQAKLQQQALISLIQAIKNKYPSAALIVNRGFELLPSIATLIKAVAAESLFSSWDNNQKKYVPVSQQERKTLIAELRKAQNLGIPVIVIDYVPANKLTYAGEIAHKILQLGFSPWVTNYNLTAFYLVQSHHHADHQANAVDAGQPVPRKILVFYNGKINNIDDEMDSVAVTKVAMPLNYLGYVPIFRNINEPLPANLSKTEFAGIVVADIGIVLGKEQQIRRWYLQQIHKGIPLVILNDFGFNLDAKSLAAFNLDYPLFPHRARKVQIIRESSLLGYEIQPLLKPEDFTAISGKDNISLLTVRDELGTIGDMAAITPWGGYVLYPAVLQNTSENSVRWVIDPFTFLQKALRLPAMPVPDTTTENGRRLMLAHIDGDSFANKGKWYNGPFVGEIMEKEFLTYYNIPTTVSIIEGELSPQGLYPQWSADLEKIARELFALPNVEIASHTFSHPFNWQKAAQYRGSKPNPYSLPIPNYHLNIAREVTGSVNYINQHLAPPGKSCKVFLWSGEADVPEKAVALTYQLSLSNMNGGDTKISKLHNSMTEVSGLGLYQGPYFLVFAPVTNDFEITDNFRKPRYSFVNVINTFKMTDSPRRLKPIDIYNHFYMVDEIGGIKAMHTVYDWALSQPVFNLYVSDYSHKVLDFNKTTITKQGNGWWFTTNGQIRELRIPHSLGYPNLAESKNVIGYNSYNDSYYIHLGPAKRSYVIFSRDKPRMPFLADANAAVKSFDYQKKKVNFTLQGYTPLEFTLANMHNCTLWDGKEQLKPASSKANQQSYHLTSEVSGDFSIQCS